MVEAQLTTARVCLHCATSSLTLTAALQETLQYETNLVKTFTVTKIKRQHNNKTGVNVLP